MIREIKEVRETVLKLLQSDPACRNSDKLLLKRIWETQGVTIPIPDKDVDLLINPESVRRSRQIIQAQGLFMPTDLEIKAKRFKEAKRMKMEMVK